MSISNEVEPVLVVESVSLAVRDIEGVAAFYQSALGLEVLATGETVALGAGGVTLLTLRHRPDLLPGDRSAAGLFHVAFLLPTGADLGHWLNHAAALGLQIDGAADHLVSEAVYLHDPEGNGIEIYSDRARSAWSWTGDQVVMANDRLDFDGLRRLRGKDWTGMPVGTVVGHVHLQVGAIPAAEAFYVGVLGFEPTRRFPQATFLSTGGYHHHIAANTWHSAGARVRRPDRAGLESVTLRAGSAAVMSGIAERAGMLTSGGLRDPWGTLVHIKT